MLSLKRTFYKVKEERYFDCPSCGKQISDDSANGQCLLDTHVDKCIDIVTGSVGRCPYCNIAILVSGAFYNKEV